MPGLAGGAVIMTQHREAGGLEVAAVGLEFHEGAVAAALPALVLAAGIGREQDPAGAQAGPKLAKDPRQFLGRDVEEAGVGEDPVETLRRQLQFQEILLPHLAAGMLARHSAEGGTALQADRAVAKAGEGGQVAARAAAEVEDVVALLRRQRLQEGLDVLPDVVVLRALPKIRRAALVVGERPLRDLF